MENIDKLIESLAQDASPAARPAPPPSRLSARWLLAAQAYIAASLLATGFRPDIMQKLHDPWYIGELLGLVGILASASWGAALLAYPDLYQRGKTLYAPGILLALFALLLGLSWQAGNPPAPLPVHSYQCTLSIGLLSILPSAWIFHSLRKFASTHVYLAGGTALLYAFCIGALWLRLHEVNNSVIHVIEWHYLPMLVAALLGTQLGKLLLKW